MEKKLPIILDLKKKNHNTLVGVKQFDNKSAIYLKIIQDNLAFDLTGLTVRANLKAADGKMYFQDSTTGVEILNALTGEVKISLANGVLETSGIVTSDISFFDAQLNKITSSTFQLSVDPSVYSEDASQNGSRPDLLYKALNDAKVAESERSFNEDDRVSSEIIRKSNEDTRLGLDATMVANESTRVSQETTRQTNETLRQTNESTRQSNETTRQTNETARQSAETARASSYASVIANYNASIASQSNIEITDARTDGNTGVVYTNLKQRLNSYTPSVIREAIPSGFTQIADIDYTYMSTNPNKIKLINRDTIAFVNGYRIVIPKDTVITLSAPPTQNPREDLVFLEVWLDQTTGVPTNRLRIVDGVDFTTYGRDGIYSSITSANWNSVNRLVTCQGGNALPIAQNVSNNPANCGAFLPALTATMNGFLLNNILEDTGLYLSGDGSATAKTTFKTLDGYSYAIPMFRVYRRPSCGFMESNELNKVSPLGNMINVGKVTAKDRIAHTGDLVNVKMEGRVPLVNLLGDAGNCEDLSKWKMNNGATLDSSIKLFGTNSFKYTANAYNPSTYMDIQCDQSHKYLISGYANISSYTSGTICLDVRDYGAVTNLTTAAFDSTKLNQWQRKSMIITGKSNGGMRLYIGDANYISTATYNIDGIMVYDLTAKYGAGNEPSDIAQLERELPYVNGIQSPKPVVMKVKGKNLFDNAKYSALGYRFGGGGVDSLTVDSLFNITDYIKIKPSTVYFRNNLGSSVGYWYDSNKSLISTINSGDNASITSPTNAMYYRTSVAVANINIAQFEEGSSATTYEAYQESSITLPPTITDLKKIGTVADDIHTITGDYTKRISDWVNLDGSLSITADITYNYIGFKRFDIIHGTPDHVLGASDKFMAIKYNNTNIGYNASISASADIGQIHGSLPTKFVITIPNTDTGFVDSYTPSQNEAKAYFYGWKMCHDDGVSPYLPSMTPYTPATWAEWSKGNNTGVLDSTGAEIIADGINYSQITIPTQIKPSVKYGILYNVISNTLTLDFRGGGTADHPFNSGMLLSKTVGNNKFVGTTSSSVVQGTTLILMVSNTEPAGNKIKIKDIRIFELPTGSQIETDFNTLTADQLVAKYLFYGLCTKNWKKVTDGTGQTTTLPTASYAGYTPYKMIYQLATPVVTNLKDNIEGRLYLQSGVNNLLQENIQQSVVTPVAVPNGLSNGDFSNGTTGWVGQYGTITSSNGILINTADGSIGAQRVYQTTSIPYTIGKKIYFRTISRVTNSVCTMFKHILTDSGSTNAINTLVLSNPVMNQFYTLSTIFTLNVNSTNIRLMLDGYYADGATANGKTMEVQQVYTVDLTSMFGAGNEPSQAWCDKYLAFGTNFKMEAPLGTTAVRGLQDSNKFDSVQGNIALIPANKYKANAVNRVFYRLAEGDYLLPDLTLTVGAQTLTVKNNASVGSVVTTDTDVPFKKNGDGGVNYTNVFTPTSVTPSLVSYLTTGTANVPSGIYNTLNVGDKLYGATSGYYGKAIFQVMSKNGTNNITFMNIRTDGLTAGALPLMIGYYRQDFMFADIIDTRDITPLQHQVSLTGYNYQSLLEESFDKLLRGTL